MERYSTKRCTILHCSQVQEAVLPKGVLPKVFYQRCSTKGVLPKVFYQRCSKIKFFCSGENPQQRTLFP